MSKAYIFPGQGSQFPGMGKALYERSAEAREMMDRANEILGFPITDIMFGEDAEALKATRVTQPAIFIHSVVLARCSGLEAPSMAAGHSLGEFSALAAAGAMDFEDALRLVAVRASAMQKCCEQVPGTMAAVIKLPTETVEEICASCAGLVIPANYNSEGQVVISGEAEAVAEACAKMKEAGAKRALPLAVSGAFHSPLMEPARLELAEAIDKTPFRAPAVPGVPERHRPPLHRPGRHQGQPPAAAHLPGPLDPDRAEHGRGRRGQFPRNRSRNGPAGPREAHRARSRKSKEYQNKST